MSATTNCPMCGRRIKYDQRLVGRVVSCPSCKQPVRLTDEMVGGSMEPPLAEPVPPDPIVARIRMVSGREHVCSAILMFDVGFVRAAERIQRQIEAKFKGFSSGLFFIGSFTSVVSRALTLGLVETVVNQQLSKSAVSQLEEFSEACIELRNSGRFIELHRIEGIKVPIPQQWKVIIGHNDAGPTGYVLYNDPGIAVMTQNGVVTILWDKVEDYSIHRLGEV